MEIEKSTMHSKALGLTEEEDAMASQVLEIIGGITLEALQTLEEPEDRNAWSLEEGDDSVFYSDEDQVHEDIKANIPFDFGVKGFRHLVNSEAGDAPQREDDPGEEVIAHLQNLEMEMEVAPQVILTEREEECKELQTSKTEPVNQSHPVDPGAESNPTPEKSVSTWGESVQLNGTAADMQIQPVQNISSGEENLPVEMSEAQTPNIEPFDVSNEENFMRLRGEPEAPNQMSSTEHLMSGDGDMEPEPDHNLHVPTGSQEDPSPGHSTLPRKSSPELHKAFNHLTSSKYSTVSYRRIRRGNTRQKIEAFEHMMMNL